MSFADLLGASVIHPWLSQIQNEWPVDFSVRDADRTFCPKHWIVKSVEDQCVEDRRHVRICLRDTESEVEVELDVVVFQAHGVVKLGGVLTNGAKAPVSIVDPKIASFRWPHALAPVPKIRRFAGGPWGDIAYPPTGYQVQDVELPPHLQHWSGVEAKCAPEDGRTSQVHQPVMGIANDTDGVLIVLEWAGAYMLSCKRDQDFWGHQADGELVASAGVAGVNVTLSPGESVPLPNAYITFYRGSLDEGCQQWRGFFRDELAPLLGGERMLPQVSYNHWIAYEIEQFTEQVAFETAERCAEAGIDYLCFDAGWATGGFRQGNGNWEVADVVKIPSGFEMLGAGVAERGVKFGCWLEPEFASRGSKLYREHPEWFISMPGDESPYSMALMNFGLVEVQDWWVEFLRDWYHRCHVRWVRWDFNQQPGPYWSANDAPDKQGMTQINHVIGLYSTLERIMEALPDLVVEQCASGGTRVEVGLLARGHICWINDHSSSPHLVRYYQHGMNTLWPARYANVNVVSRDGVLTESEWLSHQAGSFGVSSRLVDWEPAQLAELKKQVDRFKGFRSKLELDFSSQSGAPRSLSGGHDLSFGNESTGILISHDLSQNSAALTVR